MKVLLINSVVENTTSTGKLVNDIAAGVLRHGYTPFIAYSQSSESVPQNSICIGIKLENKIHAILSRLTGFQGYFSPIGTMRLIRLARREQIDIIHLHNIHSNDLCLPILYRYIIRNNIPLVITLHDCWHYTARCFHYTKAQCMQWKEHCKRCDRRTCRTNDYWFGSMAYWLFSNKRRWYSRIQNLYTVGVSEWITHEARISMLRCSKSIQTILNWIDTDIFAPCDTQDFRRKHGLKDEKIALGVCGCWSIDKGIEDIVTLSKKLPQHTRLILVGEVPDVYKEMMGGDVIYVGRIKDKRELAKAYSAADVYINLSLEESFGLTNAEALACGTPILVYTSTAGTEFISSGCGYGAKPGNIDDLAYGLECILKQVDGAMKEKCRTLALQRFSPTQNVDQYVSLYESVHNNGG